MASGRAPGARRHAPTGDRRARPVASRAVSPRKLVLKTGAVAVLAVAGCGGGSAVYDVLVAQDTAQQAVVNRVGAKVRSVTCPGDVEPEKGKALTCAVRGTDGSIGPVKVTPTGEGDKVTVEVPLLNVRELENTIALGLGKRLGGVNIRVSCPEIVEVRKADTFMCQATQGASKGPVQVTQADGQGNVTYGLVNGKGG